MSKPFLIYGLFDPDPSKRVCTVMHTTTPKVIESIERNDPLNSTALHAWKQYTRANSHSMRLSIPLSRWFKTLLDRGVDPKPRVLHYGQTDNLLVIKTEKERSITMLLDLGYHCVGSLGGHVRGSKTLEKSSLLEVAERTTP